MNRRNFFYDFSFLRRIKTVFEKNKILICKFLSEWIFLNNTNFEIEKTATSHSGYLFYLGDFLSGSVFFR